MPRARAVWEWLKDLRTRENPPDLIDQLLPDGTEMMMLTGRPQTGKTNMVLDLGLCLATGTPFLGLFKCRKVPVTYLGFEGAPIKLGERLERLLPNYPNPGDYFRFESLSPMRIDQKTQELMNYIEGSKVVIFDSLKHLVSGDYCKPEFAHAFLTALKQVSQSLQVSTILCHHVRKSHPGIRVEPDDLFQIKGAADYVETATTALLLEKMKRTTDHYVLHFLKARDALEELAPLELLFNRSTLRFEFQRKLNPESL